MAMTDETNESNGCINLKLLFGARWKVTTCESYFADTGSTSGNNKDPWYWIIRGRHGHISPRGGEILHCCIDEGHPRLCGQLLSQPWIIKELSQVGEDGVNAAFHVTHIEKAAAFIQAYRRYQLSDVDRKRRAAHMRRIRRGNENNGYTNV